MSETIRITWKQAIIATLTILLVGTAYFYGVGYLIATSTLIDVPGIGYIHFIAFYLVVVAALVLIYRCFGIKLD